MPPVQVVMDEATLAKADRIAKSEGRSRSNAIRHAINEYKLESE
jgi:metal-responsive CopG/Arc/MetJ family transcriptional regulator